MVKDTKNTLTLDDVEYQIDEMKPEQQAMVAHIQDLDRKINSAKFGLDQLSVGQAAFIKMLKESLEDK